MPADLGLEQVEGIAFELACAIGRDDFEVSAFGSRNLRGFRRED